MKKILHRILAAVWSVFLAALLTKPFESGLSQIGWFSGSWLATVVTTLDRVWSWSGFPWVAGMLIGLTAGTLLDTLARWIDGRHPIWPKDKARSIATSASILGHEIDVMVNPYWGTASYDPTQYVKVVSMFKKLERLGLEVPKLAEPGDKPVDLMREYSAYLRQVAVPLEDGDLDLARNLSHIHSLRRTNSSA